MENTSSVFMNIYSVHILRIDISRLYDLFLSLNKTLFATLLLCLICNTEKALLLQIHLKIVFHTLLSLSIFCQPSINCNSCNHHTFLYICVSFHLADNSVFAGFLPIFNKFHRTPYLYLQAMVPLQISYLDSIQYYI